MLNADLITDSRALLDARDVGATATRRTALKAALGVGYAAAALPIMAQTAIKTPADGLTAGDPGGIHADYGGSDRRNQRRHFVVEPRQSRNFALTER